MGYSVFVTCKSIQARDKMVGFLRAHPHSWADVARLSGEPLEWSGCCTEHLCVGREALPYNATDKAIGFNLRPEDSAWAWALVRWMAIRVGRCQKMKVPSLDDSVYGPYFWYDCEHTIPVLFRKDWEAAYQKAIEADLKANPERDWSPIAHSVYSLVDEDGIPDWVVLSDPDFTRYSKSLIQHGMDPDEVQAKLDRNEKRAKYGIEVLKLLTESWNNTQPKT